MEYCEECGGLVVPEKSSDETSYACRSCGKPHAETDEGEMVITEEADSETHITVDEDEESLPVTDAECEECGNDEAHWWMEQTRSADEPETRFYRCTECQHTWRVYD